MVQRIQMLNPGQRLLIFALFMVGGLMLLVALVVLLIILTASSGSRLTSVSLAEGFTVREFTTLPGDDVYPAAVTVAPDGTVYTASYATGAVYSVSTNDRTVTEIPGTRDALTTVTGLEAGPDGTLYIAGFYRPEGDDLSGGIWRVTPDGLLEQFTSFARNAEFVFMDDITLDAEGNIYITDRTRSEIWRFDPTGNGAPWWNVPASDARAPDVVPTGLAYNAVTDSLIVTDSEANTIYSISLEDGSTRILYRYPGTRDAPSFDGVTVAPDGTIYVAALAESQIGMLRDEQIIYIAGSFRGSSDVTYHEGQLYVANFDSRALVDPTRRPQLPFGLDVITLP